MIEETADPEAAAAAVQPFPSILWIPVLRVATIKRVVAAAAVEVAAIGAIP
jgi:hypothetical protein